MLATCNSMVSSVMITGQYPNGLGARCWVIAESKRNIWTVYPKPNPYPIFLGRSQDSSTFSSTRLAKVAFEAFKFNNANPP